MTQQLLGKIFVLTKKVESQRLQIALMYISQSKENCGVDLDYSCGPVSVVNAVQMWRRMHKYKVDPGQLDIQHVTFNKSWKQPVKNLVSSVNARV